MAYIINPYKAYQYFRDNFVLGKPSPKKWYPFDCPFCGKRNKMAVQFIRSQTKCWSCGADASIVTFVAELEKVDEYEANQILWNITPSNLKLELLEEEISLNKEVYNGYLPHGYKALMQGATSLGHRARDYWERRGFDPVELDMMGFGYCNKHYADDKNQDYFGYTIIPYKRKGKLVYYIGRDYIGNGLRYKNPTAEVFGIGKADVVFNEDALALYDTVFLMEGAIDAMTIGKRATATSGWALSKYQLSAYFSSKVKRLVFIPDAGADNQGVTFYQKAVKTAMLFLDTHIQPYVMDLNGKDFADLGKDVNEIGKDNILKKFKHDTPPLTWGLAMSVL